MKRCNLYVLLSILLIAVSGNAQTTRYVRPAATGTGSGSSWDNASNDLQLIINQSVSGDKIFVAAGTYVPNRKANDVETITTNNTDNAFVLKEGVAVYGGFDPDNGSSILANRRAMPGSGSASILSGDMDGDNSGNAYHVVIIAGGGDYTLDGFVIQRGNSTAASSNIIVNGQAVVKNRGGGIYITNTTNGIPYIRNCWIRGNRANMGGGAYTDVVAFFTNCIFSGNYTTTSNGQYSYGAGLYNSGTASFLGTLLVNCTFSGNRASASSNARGGAAYNTGALILANTIIYSNSTAGNQPGIHNNGGNVSAYNSRIGDNSQITSNNNSVSGNPQFVNAPDSGTAPFITGDYKLNSNSSVLNDGDNSWASSAGTIDIQGLNRLNGTVDLGAHERGASYPAMVNSIRYVKPNGTGDGTSWANASGDLQGMINYSISGDQIFVAGGTYLPNRKANAINTITPNNRDNSFLLKDGVKIYGNFAGTETSLAQRDLSDTANKSILSGDFNGNDGVSGSGSTLTFSNKGENAYHVVMASGTSANPVGWGTLLDGFTIKGGYANGTGSITVNEATPYRNEGGGLCLAMNSYSYPAIANCIFTENYGSVGGGAVSNISLASVATFTNCVFFKNSGYNGGVFYLYQGVQLTNCTIWGNRTTSTNNNGVADVYNTTLTVRNSIVYGNDSGIRIVGGGSLSQNNSLVQGETSTENGNINGSTNPLFVNASGGDFRLQFLSPAANKGSNDLVPSGITTDIAGNTRIIDCAVDMGAYEREAIPAPLADASQTFCAGETVTVLEVTGENLQWYDVADGGSPLASDTEIFEGTYYVSQTINGCAGSRTAVTVTYQVEAPTAPSPQSAASGALVYNLIATGENLQWYSTATGGTALTEITASGTYYVSQTIDGCESGRTAVTLTIAYTARYVKPVATGSGDGSNWANASDDLQAMINASSNGHYIFVAGGTYKPNRKLNDTETITPNNRDNAFVLKNGVKIYGNFAGTETSLAQRDLSDTANKSILSGDFNGNDNVSGSAGSLSITNNGENAYHVVISAGTIGSGTVLDGFTITGGNANVSGSIITVNGATIEKGHGGGLYCEGVNSSSYSSPTVTNCIFTANVALHYGGGIYNLYANPTLTNCIFSKNGAINSGVFGSAIFFFLSGTITNCTFWGTRGGNSTIYIMNGTLNVRNSIVYGNSSGILKGSSNATINIRNSLVQGQTSTENGNINGSTNPRFTNASGGDFSLQMTSPVINKGNNSYVSSGITTDIAGNTRIQLNTVDMGAYESDRHGTIWTTSNSWLNNVEPDIEKEVFIQGDLSVGTAYGSFEAKTLTVEESGSLIIETGSSVTVKETVTNEAEATDFVIENNGILLQTDDVENEGAVTVLRNSNPMKRLDYTLWSSSVAGMLLKDFSQVSPSGGVGTLWNRVYSLGETAWEQVWTSQPDFNTDNKEFETAKGYLYRSRNDYDAVNTVLFEGEFTGVPHNGSISIDTPYLFNAVGNPYPSPIDADDFIMSNTGVNALYFWTNVNAPVDGSYTLNNWAYYTLMGGTGVQLNGAGMQFYIPEGTIQTGQGFLAGITGSVPQVTFNNTMRVAENGAFFKQMSSEKHRFWLNLSNEEAILNQILIGYVENATQGVDTGIDAEMFGYEGSAVYSLIGNSEEKFVIQGRELPFTDSDIVPLGFRAVSAGSFSLSLHDFDGIFEQENIIIYLKDSFTQAYYNLKNGAYTFVSEEGIFDDRFEVVYQTTMSIQNPDLQHNWIVFKQDKGFQIQTNGFDMKEVSVYDLLGRQIYTSEAAGTAHQIPALGADGVYIVKVTTTENKVLNKKVR